MKKTIVTTLAFSVLMGAAVAQAGNIPEFDAVGNDAMNYFAARNSAQYGQVIKNNVGNKGQLELMSAFRCERFYQEAGALIDDPVFPGMLTALTDVWNEGYYEWWICLQMKPESDLNINIYDSVLKHNEFSPWWAAEQTGRYRMPWGQLMFNAIANPQITVTAYPGPYQVSNPPKLPFVMEYRTMPGLEKGLLQEAVYTSKCLWSENIVVAMPETGQSNQLEQKMYNLKQGDCIKVQIYVPDANTTDIRYGKDSVTIKYIGIVGTWLYGAEGTDEI